MKCEENGCATSWICKLKIHNNIYILGTKHEENYIGRQFDSKNFHIDFLVITTYTTSDQLYNCAYESTYIVSAV